MKIAALVAVMAAMTVFCGCTSCWHKSSTGKISPVTMGADPNCGDSADCHVKRIREQMEHLVQHLRYDSKKVSDPKAKAMFETSAEAINGLIKAFDDYENRKEAWR
jgi:hypothetical protein